jgi:hypothetical protein
MRIRSCIPTRWEDAHRDCHQRGADGHRRADPLAGLLPLRSEISVSELARLVVALDEAAQPQLRQAAGLYLSNAFGSRSVRYKALGRDFYASLGRAYDLVLAGCSLDFSVGPGKRSTRKSCCAPYAVRQGR